MQVAGGKEGRRAVDKNCSIGDTILTTFCFKEWVSEFSSETSSCGGEDKKKPQKTNKKQKMFDTLWNVVSLIR